jgi:hypothetical protein
MKRHRTTWYSVATPTATGLYRRYTHAMSAAAWSARLTGRRIEVRAEPSGQRWYVRPNGAAYAGSAISQPPVTLQGKPGAENTAAAKVRAFADREGGGPSV